jgi:hypothetical protein
MADEISQLGKDLRAIHEEIMQEEAQEQTPPPGAGLDIAGIEARLKAFKTVTVKFNVSFTAPDEDCQAILEFITNAPTDVAALLGEVHRLRLEVNKMARADYGFDVWETGRATGEFTPPYPDEVEQ